MAGRQSPILDHTGKPYRRPAPGRRAVLRSRYDAAQTTDDNRRHWAAADGLSARAANSPHVRRLLRNRSRYEQANNGYCGGLVRTLATDLIGTGPRLQCQSENEALNRTVERAFHQWADAAGLVETSITGHQAKVGDGEAFALLVNEQVGDPEPEPVQLNVIGVECDQVTTPANASVPNPDQWVDGIELDGRGRPLWYHVLKVHPGDQVAGMVWGEYERLAVRQVLHWFRKDRAGQVRGIPEITPGLPLCSQLRRWTLATLSAAETAADFAAMLKTSGPADPDESEENTDPPFTTLEIERGMMTTLPDGCEIQQLKAEHPGTEYPSFKGELLKEFGRPVSAPLNVVSGSSAEYNFSSGRMDLLLYRQAKRVERETCRRHWLDRVFAAWYAEARLIPGYLANDLAALPQAMPHGWYWPGFEAIDPEKEARADTERLTNCTTTLQELLAEYGQDWEVFLRQRARERALMEELGLPIPAWMGSSPPPPPTAGPAPEDEGEPSDNEDEDLEDEEPTGRVRRRKVLNGHYGHR